MKPRRVQLLVSVRSAGEALAALDGGADIIDIKDPSKGPLGMASLRTIERVLDAVNGRAPVSAALGELADVSKDLTLPSGLSFAKAGLHGQRTARWQSRLSRLFEGIGGARAVGVVYIDCLGGNDPHRSPEFDALLRWAVGHGAAGILIDTFKKTGGGLFQTTLPDPKWREWTRKLIGQYVREARAAKLFIALAGQLSGATLEEALTLEPDILAVRGAACFGGDRNAGIDAQRVAGLRSLIEVHNARTAASAG